MTFTSKIYCFCKQVGEGGKSEKEELKKEGRKVPFSGLAREEVPTLPTHKLPSPGPADGLGNDV